MQNDMRDRLVPVIKNSLMKNIGKSCNLAENIADDLIASSVDMLYCNVGDIVYFIDFNDENKIKNLKIDHIRCTRCTSYFGDGEIIDYEILAIPADQQRKGQSIPLTRLMAKWFGEYVFYNEEQAEQKLKEMRGE